IDALRSARMIRSYWIGDSIARTNEAGFERFHERSATLGRTQARGGFEAELLGALLVAAVLIPGTLRVDGKERTLGALMAPYSLATAALSSCARLAESYLAMQGVAASASRIMDVLALRPEGEQGGRAFPAGEPIRLEGIGFAWPNGAALLNDVWLTLVPGRIVAVRGRSGSGKSTLVKVLHRHYTPT